ncbi:MAG: DegV family protein [Oscillospiraceae bacterium]|nr:DegV family protein [Oscillospiraceae bacterium]
MNDYVIMTDSCCDLPNEIAERYGLVSVPLSITVDDKVYEANIDEKVITFDRFYELLAASSSASTAAINAAQFIERMEPLLIAGRDILYLAFSSGLSATFSSSVMAVEELRKKYPDRKLCVVDTLCASMGEGLLVYYAALEKAKGATIEEVRDFAEKTKREICHWFFVDELSYLKRGGRISSSVALVGSLLNIKPILKVDREGKLAAYSKARGIKNALKTMLEYMGETIRNAADQTIMISHAHARERANELADGIRQRFPEIKEIIFNHIGPTIGCHTGQGCIALFFRGIMPT